MKQIIVIITILSTFTCQAQSPVYELGKSPVVKPDNCYLKDINNVLDKFEGTWVYKQGNKEFTITLEKQEMVKLINYYKDILFGSYIYKENGTEVVNTTSFTGKASELRGAILWKNNPNKVTIFFDDPSRPNVSYEATLTYSNFKGIKKLDWKLKITGVSAQLPGESPAIQDYRVPKDVVLSKQLNIVIP